MSVSIHLHSKIDRGNEGEEIRVSEKEERTCAVQGVNVFLTRGSLLLDAKTDFQLACLVVCAVGNGDEFLVFTATSDGEPGLEITLHGCCVVCTILAPSCTASMKIRHTQRSGNDVDDLVRQAKALVELFRRGQHALKRLPRLLGVSDEELLDLLKLVYPENTPRVLSVRASLFPEVGRVPSVLDGQVCGAEPLLRVQGGDGLLGGGDEVLVCLGLVLALGDLVQLVVEVGQLGCLGHLVAEHEERRLVGGVALVEEELEAVVDEGEVEEETVACQTVAPVADNLDAALRVVAVQSCEDAVVGDAVLLELGLPLLGRPCLDDSVVVLGGRDRDVLVDVVANRLGLLVESDELLRSLLFLGGLLLLQLRHLGEELIGALLGLLLLPDLLLQPVYLRANLRGGILCLAVVLEQLDDLVDNLDGRMALALRLADLLWVTAALCDKVVAVYPAMLACLRLVVAENGKRPCRPSAADKGRGLHVKHLVSRVQVCAVSIARVQVVAARGHTNVVVRYGALRLSQGP